MTFFSVLSIPTLSNKLEWVMYWVIVAESDFVECRLWRKWQRCAKMHGVYNGENTVFEIENHGSFCSNIDQEKVDKVEMNVKLIV